MVETPPADQLQSVLAKVAAGGFTTGPHAVEGLDPGERAALAYAVGHGLVDEQAAALTEAGRRYLYLLGGAR